MDYNLVKTSKLDYLLLEPLSKKSFNLSFIRIMQVLHNYSNGFVSEIFNKFHRFINPKKKFPKSQFLSDEQINFYAKSLKEDGYAYLDYQFPEKEVEELKLFLFSEKTEQNIYIKDNNIDSKINRYTWDINKIIRHPIIQKYIFKDVFFHKIAQEYLNEYPKLCSIDFWLDTEGNKSYGAHIMHYDNDGPNRLKFFVYLTDVNIEEDGAHIFIKNSHSNIKPKKFKVSKRYTDEELFKYYGLDSKISHIAKAGSIIAEDTMGFHRGSDIKSGKYRILMQLEYSSIDIAYYPKSNIKVDKIDINIDKVLKKCLANYIERN